MSKELRNEFLKSTGNLAVETVNGVKRHVHQYVTALEEEIIALRAIIANTADKVKDNVEAVVYDVQDVAKDLKEHGEKIIEDIKDVFKNDEKPSTKKKGKNRFQK